MNKKIATITTLLTILFFNYSTSFSQLNKMRVKSNAPTIPLKKMKDVIATPNELQTRIETINGITYKLFINSSNQTMYRKGILVMGSGNNENAPIVGSLDGVNENNLCRMAAQNGYVAAIVQYTAGPGVSNWNVSAEQLANDYDKCINAIATTYAIPKTQTVIGGYSYAAFMLLTANAYFPILNYCKGVLAPCSTTSTATAANFKIPIYNICCAGGNEIFGENVNGTTLYNAINLTVKMKSECVIDNSCNSHCGGNWTNQLYNKMIGWFL